MVIVHVKLQFGLKKSAFNREVVLMLRPSLDEVPMYLPWKAVTPLPSKRVFKLSNLAGLWQVKECVNGR